jgi:predicted kinase
MRSATVRKALLLLTGVPGSGKSTLARLACERRRAFLVILEEEPVAGDVRGHELRRIWIRDLASGTAQAFVRAVRNDSREVVVEWGFPVTPQCIAFVKSMKENGMRLVWFECADDVARERFTSRGTVSLEAFEAQIQAIRANYSAIMDEIQPEVIDVLNADGSARSPEALFALIFGEMP